MPDYSAWLTKQQAADALQCATKTVEQLSTQGKLQSALYKRPEGGPKLRVYHPKDVERLRKERNPDAEPFIVPSESATSTALQRTGNNITMNDAMLGFFRGLNAGEAQNPPAVSIRDKMFLTMPEAVQLTGLPDAVIRRMIHDYRSFKTGAPIVTAIMTGQGWRIRRKDLEAL